MNRLLQARRSGLWALVICAAYLATGPAAHGDERVYRQVLPSTVWVQSPKPDGKTSSIGTGAVVDAKRRLVVTNFHVVEKRPDVTVFFPSFEDGQLVAEVDHYRGNNKLGIRGKVLVSQSQVDVAIIQLESLPAGARAVPLAATPPRAGQEIHAIGNSGSNNGSLWRYSRGEIRQVFKAKFRTNIGTGGSFEVAARVVETQVPINAGDSGGPMFNNRGELVAISQSTFDKFHLVSRGIEVSEVRKVLFSVAGGVQVREPELAEPQPQPRTQNPAVVGLWNITVTNAEGRQSQWSGRFNADGTFAWSFQKRDGATQTVRGRFTISGTTMSIDSDTFREQVALTLNGDKKFSFATDKLKFAFERR